MTARSRLTSLLQTANAKIIESPIWKLLLRTLSSQNELIVITVVVKAQINCNFHPETVVKLHTPE
jgi:hypothetical protein